MPTWNVTVYDPELTPVEKKALKGNVSADAIAEKFLEGMADSQDFLILKILDTESGEISIYPDEGPVTEPLGQAEDLVEEFFRTELWVELIKLAEGILSGPHGKLPEGQLLAASVYDRLGWDDLAAQVFKRICAESSQPLLGSTQVRLAKSLLGLKQEPEEVVRLLNEALSSESLPAAQRIDALVLLAEQAEPEEALEKVRQARLLCLEHYGKVHPLTAALFAKEGRLLEDSEVDAAIATYAAAYGIYLELGDRMIFSVLESLVLIYLKTGKPEQAFRDSTKAIQLIEQDPVSAPMMVTWLVLNAQSLVDSNKKELGRVVMQRAQAMNTSEAFRIWSELQQMLNRKDG